MYVSKFKFRRYLKSCECSGVRSKPVIMTILRFIWLGLIPVLLLQSSSFVAQETKQNNPKNVGPDINGPDQNEVAETVDPGFNLFFASSDREMENVPIYFNKPLPEWLKGSLVSFLE